MRISNKIKNVNEKNINLSKENITRENNNSYLFNNIDSFQQLHIQLLQEISAKSLELNKNIVAFNQSPYLYFLYNSGIRIYDDIKKGYIIIYQI